MNRQALKRKLGPNSHSSRSRKKVKLSSFRKSTSTTNRTETHAAALPTASLDDLPWKAIHSEGVGEFAADGILMLEEVENVEVVSEGDGRVVHFRVKEPHANKRVLDENSGVEETLSYPYPTSPNIFDAFDSATLLPAWTSYSLHPALLQSIHRRGFQTPTSIQRKTLEIFLGGCIPEQSESNDAKGRRQDEAMRQLSDSKRRDVIGIAETGSGKTLAYGLPILHHLLTMLSTIPPSKDASTSAITITLSALAQRRPLQALVLAPTRELALQVSEHLNACLDQLHSAQSRVNNEGGKKQGQKPPPALSVAAIVGGMSAQKQRRILSRGVDVLVATPGRFWDICGEDPTLAAQLRLLRFLVLDEADRMVEAGHFQELDNILRLTSRPSLDINTDVDVGDPPRPADSAYADPEVNVRNDALQTFVFSATMSKELQHDLKRRHGGPKRKDTRTSTLDDLLMKLDFRDPDPVIIDLSPEGGHVEGLQESKVECLTNDKDLYLYYFLQRHPGRSLVFLSSIDGIRRLMPLLELLKCSVWPLHSGLQQKQRLKNLDRFKSTPNSVLLATDIAARGLDVPAVDHVIHYQVPRSADVYVHRNGRTARAMRKGFGLVLCAPDERRVFRGVLAGLGRDEDDIPELGMEHHLVDKLKARVQLARRIDGMTHRTRKEIHDRKWIRETAEAMEVELPSELESDGSEDVRITSKKRVIDGQVVGLKAELKEMLARPVMARGVSTKYITSGSRAIVNDILEGQSHETLLGLRRTEAGGEVVRKKEEKKKTQQQQKGS